MRMIVKQNKNLDLQSKLMQVFQYFKIGFLLRLMSKSPLKTAIAVANSMVGTSLLVLPVNYLEKGIIQNACGAVIMAVIMGSTAYAIGTLVSGKQKELFKVVKRQMGPTYSNVLAILSSILTTLVGCIIFLLASDILYEMCQTFSCKTISSMGPKIFKSILLIFFLPFCALNSLQKLVKFSFISMALIWVYIMTIIYSFIENIPNIDSKVLELNTQINFSNIQFWLAVQGFSFICHPTLDAVLKENGKPQKNGKAVLGGYAMSFVVMVACGVLGALALYKKDKKKQDDNVIDYFIGHWQYYVLGVSIFIYLLLLFPILVFVSRIQILQILPEKVKQQPNINLKMKIVLMVVFVGLIELFLLLNTTPAAVMGFVATTVCFYICYFLPIAIKIKLINLADSIDDNRSNSSSLISSNQYLSTATIQPERQLLPAAEKSTRKIHKILYIAILIFGAVLMIGEVWSLVYGFIK